MEFKFVLFTGSREIDVVKARRTVTAILSKYDPKDTVIVVGDAQGVDAIVKSDAIKRGFIVFECHAKGAWATFGRGGGLARNTAMVDIVSEGHAIWNGKSRGTLDSIDKLKCVGKKVSVVTISV